MNKKLGNDHRLALALWTSGIHEARILATLVEDPARVSEAQMEKCVSEIDSWEICDASCGNLFDKTPFAYDKAVEWSKRGEEFVKRAGFVLMGELAAHDKNASDESFMHFFAAIERGSEDERNFVKKAANWALGQIGKKDLKLNRVALKAARRIAGKESRSSRWVAADAIRELTSESVMEKLRRSS